MTFDPTSIKPSDELIRKRAASNTSCFDDYIFFARWGAAQAVEALRHQWPEPITDRPPTEQDGDDLGMVQYLFNGRWSFVTWERVANDQHLAPAWLHTPGWRPKPDPSPKQQALALLKIAASDNFVAGGFSPDGIELLRQVVESAPDTTP